MPKNSRHNFSRCQRSVYAVLWIHPRRYIKGVSIVGVSLVGGQRSVVEYLAIHNYVVLF